MSIAKDIVDTIEKGELVDAKELINQGIKEKAYTKVREEELFGMITGGCLISDGSMFKTLCTVLPNK